MRLHIPPQSHARPLFTHRLQVDMATYDIRPVLCPRQRQHGQSTRTPPGLCLADNYWDVVRALRRNPFFKADLCFLPGFSCLIAPYG